MQRIYLPEIKLSDILEISERQLYHQLTRVLRARIWQQVIFFDGKNLEDSIYSMIHIDKSSVSFKRVQIIPKSSELPVSLKLYQACPNKLSKFESIAQKCSEVWFSEIVFFESERSQKLVVSDSKKQRLMKIAIESIEQCWGNIIPKISYYNQVPSIDWKTIVCHTQQWESVPLGDIVLTESLSVVVWPEWWLNQNELESLNGSESQRVYFWDRVLRCETVAPLIWFYISQKRES